MWNASRKPLAGEFRFRGRPVFVIANHFNSKGGDQNADGRFQFPAQTSAVQRAGQAKVVHDFVQGDPRRWNKKADVVVLGDLNDYQFSPALAALRPAQRRRAADPHRPDRDAPADQQYTYVFDGVSQVLDHILVTPAVGGVAVPGDPHQRRVHRPGRATTTPGRADQPVGAYASSSSREPGTARRARRPR